MKAKRLLAVFAAFTMSAALFAVGCNNGGSDTAGGGPDTDNEQDGGNTPGGENTDPDGDTAGGAEEQRPDNLPAQTTVYLVGDSTVCSFNDAYYLPRYGYGTQLINYLNETKVTIKNYAVSGRSSLSFLTDSNGNYDKLVKELSQGDYLIIGFGHNDEKAEAARYTNPNKEYTDSSTENGISFQFNLYENYIKVAKEAGATPILCTPIVRANENNNYSGSSAHITSDATGSSDGVTYKGGDYAQAIRNLGAATDTTVIDLTRITADHYKEIGYQNAINYHAFKKTENGVRVDKSVDDTHINKYGAKMVSYNLVTALKKTTNTLKWFVKDDISAPAYEVDYNDAINPDYVEKQYTAFNTEGYTDPWGLETEGWYGTVFGDCGSNNPLTAKNSTTGEKQFTIEDNPEENSFHLKVIDNKGKITTGSEGIAVAFRQVSKSYNFKITATVDVSGYDNSKQNGFGIMLRDDIYINENDASILSNYMAAGVYNDGTNQILYSREAETLSKGQYAASSLSGLYEVSIERNGQSVTITFGEYSYTQTDFDFFAIDNDYMYICLYAARNSDITFTNVQFTITGEAQDA